MFLISVYLQRYKASEATQKGVIGSTGLPTSAVGCWSRRRDDGNLAFSTRASSSDLIMGLEDETCVTQVFLLL